MTERELLKKIVLPQELKELIEKTNKKIFIPESRSQLIDMAFGEDNVDLFEVAYEVEGKGRVVEATVAKCKNGAAVNYTDIYMRRRDPDCMVIADDDDTDKAKYKNKYGDNFKELRQKSFEWLAEQDLIIMPFMSGGSDLGYPSLLVSPANASFFAAGLSDLQKLIPASKITDGFNPKAIIYLAPTFRHTHFEGKQIVVHNRLEGLHELFSYNLYPGPSAKKGVYGVLLNLGEREQEGWVTAHASTVRIITPYDNTLAIMHEGASGGGKSEMLEPIHREPDGKMLFGVNVVSKEKVYMDINEEGILEPVTDDMALCHPSLQNGKKLVVKDAEDGWFLRINHIDKYGTDPYYERLCTHPKEPLIFLNIDGVPKATCLIWEHTLDAPGKPCPNPRVILPRHHIPNIVNEPVEVDVRSFGVRMPPCTKENPTYGIMGLFHVLPPALAWIWRLVAPRGYANPSVVTSDDAGMSSEGVGSYWPFATGKRVDQANLLLRQIVNTPETRYVLIPNQHVGSYKVGFMAEWIAREYISRKGGAKFKDDQLSESRCPLLGYALESLKIDGVQIRKVFLQTNLQPELGDEAYDKGAKILTDFFKKELKKFVSPNLDPLGMEIINCALNDGSVADYLKFLPMKIK